MIKFVTAYECNCIISTKADVGFVIYIYLHFCFMKNTIKKQLIFIPLLFAATGMNAQTVAYTYDNAGSRTGRTIQGAPAKSPQATEAKKTVTALPEPVADSDILVYPNPTSGHLTMDIVNPAHENLKGEVYLFDMKGRLLKKKSIHSHSEHKKLDFNISHQAAGTYLLNIRIGENTFTRKIIKK